MELLIADQDGGRVGGDSGEQLKEGS